MERIQPELIKKALEMSDKACETIYEIQKKALKEVVENE